MRNPKKVPILEPWLVRNRWEPLGFGLENRRVLGYLMPYYQVYTLEQILLDKSSCKQQLGFRRRTQFNDFLQFIMGNVFSWYTRVLQVFICVFDMNNRKVL